MALDKQSFVVGSLDIDVTIDGAGTGAIASVDAINDGGSGYPLGFKVTEAILAGAGLPTAFVLTVDGVDGTGAITSLAISSSAADGTTGAANGTYAGGTITGVTDSSDYFDHANYEQGGVVEEYKTGTGAVATIATNAISALSGGVNYRVGDVVYAGGGDNGATATVDTVDVDGAITAFTAGATGAGYVDGDYNTVFVSRKLNQTATGDYAGANADNDPTVEVVRKADGQQWMVQKRYIDGGTIEVFAEPTTVNSVGEVVGNTIRAEDITDEYRCVAVYLSDGVTPRYVWDTSATGDAAQAGYGFCREKTAAELSGDALVDADCPAGLVHSAGDCVVVAFGTVNTDELAETINSKVAMEQCLAGGNWYEPSEAIGSRCIEAVADNFSLANFSYTTTSSAQDYAATICQQMGFDWEGAPSYTCVDPVDVTTLVTQDTCAAAGHVWVAGTCYNKADFGDGYSRQGNEGNTDPDKLPK